MRAVPLVLFAFLLGVFLGTNSPFSRQSAPPPPIPYAERERPQSFVQPTLPEGAYFYDDLEDGIGAHVPPRYMDVEPPGVPPPGRGHLMGYTGNIAHDGRPTFSQLLPENRGYINVKIRTARFAKQAAEAVKNWQELAQKYIGRDLFRTVPAGTSPSDYQVEIIDQGMESEFGAWFTATCKNFTQVSPWAWAGVWTYLEHSSMVCLNPNKPNDAGVLAHELGHVLGLEELSQIMYTETYFVLGSCPKDWGAKSIMAYNYPLPWKNFWPADLRPTKEDLLGPWACDKTVPGGIDAIYGYTQSRGMGGQFMPQTPAAPPSSEATALPSQNNTDAPPILRKDEQTTGPSDVQAPPAYIVKRDDTMWNIAQCFDIPLRELTVLNPQMENPSLIHRGNRVYLPERIVLPASYPCVQRK